MITLNEKDYVDFLRKYDSLIDKLNQERLFPEFAADYIEALVLLYIQRVPSYFSSHFLQNFKILISEKSS